MFHFDSVISEIYHEKFLDQLFNRDDTQITKQKFCESISGSVGNDMRKLSGLKFDLKNEWLFTPSILRSIFQEEV